MATGKDKGQLLTLAQFRQAFAGDQVAAWVGIDTRTPGTAMKGFVTSVNGRKVDVRFRLTPDAATGNVTATDIRRLPARTTGPSSTALRRGHGLIRIQASEATLAQQPAGRANE